LWFPTLSCFLIDIYLMSFADIQVRLPDSQF
jgi:hypothetical protein